MVEEYGRFFRLLPGLASSAQAFALLPSGRSPCFFDQIWRMFQLEPVLRCSKTNQSEKTMKSFAAAIRNGETGFAVHNSVFLPFHCEIISIWIGKEMSLLSVPDEITDLLDAEVIGIREGESYTNLVFRKWGDLSRELGNHKGHIILQAAEKGEDIFKDENRLYIKIGFHDHRKELSFEIINNPFEL